MYLVIDKSYTYVIRKNRERDRLNIFTKKHKAIVQELVYYKLENKAVQEVFKRVALTVIGEKTLLKIR